MRKKTLLISSLKTVVATFMVFLIVACASGSSDDWPKMQADELWLELEKRNTASNETSKSAPAAASDPNPSKPPFEGAPLALTDIRVMLAEIERDLPFRMQSIAAAVDLFENAADTDKALHWRGVELEKSRLNGQTRIQIAQSDASLAQYPKHATASDVHLRTPLMADPPTGASPGAPKGKALAGQALAQRSQIAQKSAKTSPCSSIKSQSIHTSAKSSLIAL